jgi:hypothetical protein
MMRRLVDLLRRAHVAVAARPRDDSGVAAETVVIVGLVTVALGVVAAVGAYVASQLGVLGG